MCPLRVVLIFLSATLAGFLLLRSLRTNPEDDEEVEVPTTESDSPLPDSTSSSCAKFRPVMSKVFWSCVDMASGRYLWRNLASSSSSSVSDGLAAPRKLQ